MTSRGTVARLVWPTSEVCQIQAGLAGDGPAPAATESTRHGVQLADDVVGQRDGFELFVGRRHLLPVPTEGGQRGDQNRTHQHQSDHDFQQRERVTTLHRTAPNNRAACLPSLQRMTCPLPPTNNTHALAPSLSISTA